MAVGDTGLQPVNLFMTLFPFLLSTLIVCARIWRRSTDHKLAIEDALIAIAQGLLLGFTVTTWIFIKKSYTGFHLEDIPKGAIDPMETAKWRYINATMYNPILALVKISFVITLVKLQCSSRAIQSTLWALLTVNIMFFFAGTLVAMLNCVPIPKFWNKSIPGHCIDPRQYIYSTIIVTIITDIWVTLMPAWILYGLQMSRKNKIVIICFLSLGLVVSAIASYRLYFFVQIFKNPNPVRNESPHNIRTPLSNIEVNLAVIAACGPTLKWILGLCIPFFDTSRTTKASAYTPNSSRSNGQRSRKVYQRSKDDMDLDVTAVDGDERDDNGSAIELKDRLGWQGIKYQADADAQSDEQGIAASGNTGGITKTVGFDVQGKDCPTAKDTPEKPRFLV